MKRYLRYGQTTHHFFFRTLLLIGLALGLTGVIKAQTDTGRVVGTVADSTGALIPGAIVTLTNTETGVKQTRTAGSDGSFVFTGVTRGSYRVEGSSQGFVTAVQNFVLEVSQVQTIDFQLTAGASDTTIEVTGAAPLVDLSTSSVGAVVDRKSVV